MLACCAVDESLLDQRCLWHSETILCDRVHRWRALLDAATKPSRNGHCLEASQPVTGGGRGNCVQPRPHLQTAKVWETSAPCQRCWLWTHLWIQAFMSDKWWTARECVGNGMDQSPKDWDWCFLKELCGMYMSFKGGVVCGLCNSVFVFLCVLKWCEECRDGTLTLSRVLRFYQKDKAGFCFSRKGGGQSTEVGLAGTSS